MPTVILLDELQCCECGVYFGLERNYHNICRQQGPKRDFYCPNGCVQHFIKAHNPDPPNPDPGEDHPVDDEEKKVVIDLKSRVKK